MSEHAEFHETVERRLLAPYHVALVLNNGSLILMASNTGAQITMDAKEAYRLLDLLYNHRDMLYRCSQDTDEQEGITGESP